MLEYDLRCKANFGQYVHAHIDPDKTNGMKNCTFPGIYLGPRGNIQGMVKVLNINTGKVKKINKNIYGGTHARQRCEASK